MELAMKMYDKIYNMKFLPPGRGLWAMGTALTEEKKLYSALNNCAFVSTDVETADELIDTFKFLQDSSMLGIGTGFDTKGKTKNFKIFKPTSYVKTFSVPDTREGWVEATGLLLESYLKPDQATVVFDYSDIRPAGEPIRIFGGVCPGEEPLRVMHELLNDLFQKHLNERSEPILGGRELVDIMNIIGKQIATGSLRSTAEIAFGDYDDKEFIELKDYNKNPDRSSWGWISNNSLLAKVGMDYSSIVDNIIQNGEPGLAWLENMRAYSRMSDEPDYRDIKAAGGNPCLEQTLEPFEICCLVETFPDKHRNLREYKETLDMAFLYAKTVTLGSPGTQWS